MNATAKIVIGAISGGTAALVATLTAKLVSAHKRTAESDSRIHDMSKYLDDMMDEAKEDFEAALGTSGEALVPHLKTQGRLEGEFETWEQAFEYIGSGDLVEKAHLGKMLCYNNLNRLVEEV